MGLLRTLVLGLTASVVLVASSVAVETPKRGGTIRLAAGPDPATNDCHAAASILSLVYLAPHYSMLLRYDPENYPNVVGDVAESWLMSSDGLTYAFKIRPNVVFHDGSKLTAADVKATYDRLHNPPEGVVSVRKADFADIASIEVTDPLTVVMRMKSPNAGMLSTFASPWNCIYSAAKLVEDPNFPAKTVIGTGPFVFTGYSPGSTWTGKRFDQYFLPGKPYLDSFTIVVMSQINLSTALAGGQIDAVLPMLSPAEAQRVAAARPDFVFQETNQAGQSLITFNVKRAPFNDVRVRRALNLAVDRWGGIGPLSKVTALKSVGGLLRPGSAGATLPEELEKLPGFRHDLEADRIEARRLLAEAGVPDLKFKFLNTNSNIYLSMAVFLLDQWRQIGVTAEIEKVESPTFVRNAMAGQYDVLNDVIVTQDDEPNPFLSKHTTGAGDNYSGVSDPVLDDLFIKQKRTFDPAARYAIARQFERRLIEQAYSVPTFWTGRIVGLPGDLKGWKITPSNRLNNDLVNMWWDR